MYSTFDLRDCIGDASTTMFDETATLEMSATMGGFEAKALL
jgi:hypothetical protein